MKDSPFCRNGNRAVQWQFTIKIIGRHAISVEILSLRCFSSHGLFRRSGRMSKNPFLEIQLKYIFHSCGELH